MSVMIQVRNVPDSLHAELKSRAAAEGITLTEYIQRILEREVGRPTPAQLRRRLAGLTRIEIEPSAAAIVREERDGR